MSRLVTFLVFALALLPSIVQGQPKRILYITHSAGYRHDSLPVSQQVLQQIAARSGKLEITATEDLSALSDLANYSAVFFFTSGELALTDTQKSNLLAFIRNGGGFGALTAPPTRSTRGLSMVISSAPDSMAIHGSRRSRSI